MKQIIVIRHDLKMRAGKMVVQGAHASQQAVVPYQRLIDHCDPFEVEKARKVREWLRESYTKICVRVNSLDELMEVYNRAVAARMIASLITDNGLTEFHGVPTITCCAIGPDTDEALDLITGGLKLL